MWELSAGQSENFRVFVTPFTLSSRYIDPIKINGNVLKTRLKDLNQSTLKTTRFGYLV